MTLSDCSISSWRESLRGPLARPELAERALSAIRARVATLKSSPRAAPVTPAPRDRAREAEAVRAIAYIYRVTDQRHADDLYAAAERHERAAEQRVDVAELRIGAVTPAPTAA